MARIYMFSRTMLAAPSMNFAMASIPINEIFNQNPGNLYPSFMLSILCDIELNYNHKTLFISKITKWVNFKS
jgi:hypothetical protein